VPDLFLKQSFQTASKTFHSINSAARGIVVPYGDEGKKIIADLYASFEIGKQYKLLRKAQRFSVNVYENVFHKLAGNGIIREIQDGTGLFCLDPQYYSDEFGLSRKIVNEMEVLIT
jgi:CRISPR-associated endonuclease/helicase Cas3